MNGRFRKLSALLATAALATGGLIAVLAAPAGAALSTCENECSVGNTALGAGFQNSGSYELGTQFHTTQGGFLEEICYGRVAEVGTDKVTLWDSAGNKLASANSPGNGCLIVNLSLPAGSYIMSYTSTSKYLQNTVNGVPGSSTGGSLLVGDQGIYAAAGSHPTITGAFDFDVFGYWASRPTDAPTAVTGTPTYGVPKFNVPGSISLAFTGDGSIYAGFRATCTQTSGKTLSVDGFGPGPIVVPGFQSIPGDTASCTVTEYGFGTYLHTAYALGNLPILAGPPSATYVEPLDPNGGVSGQGCTGAVTAPKQVTAAAQAYPGAVVSWAPVISDPADCVAGYVITPSTGSPVTVLGHGTTTLMKGPFTFGSTVSFTVAAVSGSGVGPASAGVSVTIGTPAAPHAVHVANAGKGAVKVAFQAGASNGAAIKRFTATCGSKSASGTASPLIVKGLKAGGTYTCTVTAANSRGTGAAARSAAVKA